MRRGFYFLAALLALLMGGGSPASAIPEPIDPGSGELNLLELVEDLPINEIDTALDNFPVPYVVVAQAGSGPPVIENKNAGSPIRIDADSSMATGKGGNDIEVEVNTELGPPRVELEINRLGSAPFATDLEVLVAFPFDAFNDEVLPGSPNLFFGYETTGPDGIDGGIAPVSEVFTFTPNVLVGTTHTFELEMDTTGASNPLRFQAGAFDGDNLVGILDAAAMSAHVEPVPAEITLGLTVDESALADPGLTSSLFDISWEATAASKVVFDYVEEETPPGGPVTDYNTTLTVDQMPTSEHLSVDLDESAGTLVLSHDASDPIDEVTLLRERADGLTIIGRATDVPTQVDLTLDLAGAATLDVNDDTLDLGLSAEQTGGFLDTSAYLGYDVGFASVDVTNAPDLTAAYDAAADTFTVAATNPGESIGAVEVVIGDDAALELPPSFEDVPTHHIFSLVDDGTHGTAAARLVHLTQGTVDLNPTGDDFGPEEVFDFELGEAAPLQAHLDTRPTSQILPGHDILATCDVDDVPAGTVHLDIDFPTDVSYTTDPPTGIDEIHCAGHIDTLNFDVLLGDLPAFFDWDYEPDGSATLRAQTDPVTPNSASVGVISVRLWDGVGPGIPGTGVLLGEALQEARFRADDTPSFSGTWTDGAGTTAYAFDTGVPAASGLFLGGAQFGASTAVDLDTFAEATATSVDNARFRDLGAGGDKRLSAGVFGIDQASYTATDAPRQVAVSYDANADHELVVDLDTTFGGRFFPDIDVDAELKVDDVPSSFDLTTDLTTAFDYTASDGIESVELVGTLDLTNDGNANNTTSIDLLVEGLPAAVKLVVDPVLDPTGNVTFTMATPIDRIELLLTGPEGIVGSDLKQIALEIDHIPANWTATWDGTGGSIAAVGDQVQLISVIVSKELPDQNGALRAPFTSRGNAVGYSPWLREIDRQWARRGAVVPPDTVDDREADFMSRLDDIYGSTQNLAEDEDRVLFRRTGDGAFQYFELRLQDLRSGSFHVSDGAADASFAVPFNDGDTHPFYVGLGQPNGEFLTIQIANLPDSLVFTADTAGAGSVVYDTNESAGRIEVYEGPLPSAGDGNDVTKFILTSAPVDLNINWDFSFPGSANFDATDPIEARFLSQNGNDRVIAVASFTDLHLDYGAQLGGDLQDDECIPPFDAPCNEYFPVAVASANFTATPGIDGMVLVYDFDDAVAANGINPSGAGEYEPLLSFLLEDLTSISGQAGFRLCMPDDPFPGFPPCLPLAPDIVAEISFTGSMNLDFWDDGGGPLNVLGDPDYVSNDPWNIVPFAYDENNRLNPFD